MDVCCVAFFTQKAKIYILKIEKVGFNKIAGVWKTLWIKLLLLGTMMCTK